MAMALLLPRPSRTRRRAQPTKPIDNGGSEPGPGQVDNEHGFMKLTKGGLMLHPTPDYS